MPAWFYLELVTGPAAEIELDTTAPVISWGTPSSNVAGTLLSIPYTIDEPGINWARLRDSAGGFTPATVFSDHIEVTIPSAAYNGQAFIEAEVQDDVDNLALRAYEFVIIGGTPIEPVVPQGVSTGKPFTYGAGAPAFLKDTQEFDAQIDLLRVRRIVTAAELSLERQKTFNFSSDSELLRSKVLEFSSYREPAHHYLQAKREDEEIVLCLAMDD